MFDERRHAPCYTQEHMMSQRRRRCSSRATCVVRRCWRAPSAVDIAGPSVGVRRTRAGPEGTKSRDLLIFLRSLQSSRQSHTCRTHRLPNISTAVCFPLLRPTLRTSSCHRLSLTETPSHTLPQTVPLVAPVSERLVPISQAPHCVCTDHKKLSSTCRRTTPSPRLPTRHQRQASPQQ